MTHSVCKKEQLKIFALRSFFQKGNGASASTSRDANNFFIFRMQNSVAKYIRLGKEKPEAILLAIVTRVLDNHYDKGKNK
jgi:hypothetical protein